MEAVRLDRLLSDLDPAGPPRLAFVRKAPAGITDRAGTLVCLSASFNPVTLAHVRLVEAACAVSPPDEVLLLLSVANVDKAIQHLPLARRLDLLLALAAPRPDVSVALASHGRFVDKAAGIRAGYPAGTRLHFLVGFDTLVRLFDPRYYVDPDAELTALFAAATFLAANRPPHSPDAVAAFLASSRVARYAAGIRTLTLPADVAVVSSTEVRARLTRRASVAGLVPPETLPLLEGWSAGAKGEGGDPPHRPAG